MRSNFDLIDPGDLIDPPKMPLPQLNLSVVAEKLHSGQSVMMLPPEVLSSSAIKVNWEVKRNSRYIEGFLVKFRIDPDSLDSNEKRLNEDVTKVAINLVKSAVATTYVLSGLGKFTMYEIWIQPYYSTVQGAESSRVPARTFEDGGCQYIIQFYKFKSNQDIRQ